MRYDNDVLIHTVDILLEAVKPLRPKDIVEELVKRKLRPKTDDPKNLLGVLLNKVLAQLQNDGFVKRTVHSHKNVCYSIEENAKEKARSLLYLHNRKALKRFEEEVMEYLLKFRQPKEMLPSIVSYLQADLVIAFGRCCQALLDGSDKDFIFWKRTGEESLQIYWRSLVNVLQRTPKDKIKEIYVPWKKLIDKMYTAETMSDYEGLIDVLEEMEKRMSDDMSELSSKGSRKRE